MRRGDITDTDIEADADATRSRRTPAHGLCDAVPVPVYLCDGVGSRVDVGARGADRGRVCRQGRECRAWACELIVLPGVVE